MHLIIFAIFYTTTLLWPYNWTINLNELPDGIDGSQSQLRYGETIYWHAPLFVHSKDSPLDVLKDWLRWVGKVFPLRISNSIQFISQTSAELYLLSPDNTNIELVIRFSMGKQKPQGYLLCPTCSSMPEDVLSSGRSDCKEKGKRDRMLRFIFVHWNVLLFCSLVNIPSCLYVGVFDTLL